MKVCVTGATGFIGAHVAAGLVAAGHDVRVTVRDRRRLRALEGIAAEPVQANVLDRRALRRAFAGAELVFHTAGLVASRPQADVWRVNAVAPRLVVEAAARAGVRRVVVTSSVGACGAARADRAANERNHWPEQGSGFVYTDAKHEGELAAFEAGERLGIEVLSANPAYVLGPALNRSLAGETSTRIVANYLRGRLPAVVDSYTNIVDVEDVAKGHLLVAMKGRRGERYILGGDNLRWSEVIERVAELSRDPSPADRPSIAGRSRGGSAAAPRTPARGARGHAPDGARLALFLGQGSAAARLLAASGGRDTRAHDRLVPRADRGRPDAGAAHALVRLDDRCRARRGQAGAAGAAEGGGERRGPEDRPLMHFFPRDEYYMRLALREAERALEHDDVPIGAVVVRNGEVLAAACNERELRKDPTAHAEILVLREAGRKLGGWRITDSVLYVTIEPCVMCAGAIVWARVPRVVFGAADAKAGAAGSVLDVLGERRLNWQPEVAAGLLAAECAALMTSFFGSRR